MLEFLHKPSTCSPSPSLTVSSIFKSPLHSVCVVCILIYHYTSLLSCSSHASRSFLSLSFHSFISLTLPTYLSSMYSSVSLSIYTSIYSSLLFPLSSPVFPPEFPRQEALESWVGFIHQWTTTTTTELKRLVEVAWLLAVEDVTLAVVGSGAAWGLVAEGRTPLYG